MPDAILSPEVAASESDVNDPERKQYAFLFSDLVNSTGLKRELNAWNYVSEVLEPHDALFRGMLTDYSNAQEVKHLGDGFLAVFGDVIDACAFALRFHRALRDYPWKLGECGMQVQSRLGIDVGFAVIVRRGDTMDVFGSNVDIASRIMSVGDGGQTLLSSTAYELATQAAPFLEMSLERSGVQPSKVRFARHGRYRIQGITSGPLEICETCLAGQTPSAPPSNYPKVINVMDEGWEPSLPDGSLNPEEIPDRPGWKLVRKIGQGSYGAVYLAEESSGEGNQRVFKFCLSVDRLPSFRNEVQNLRQIRDKLSRRYDVVGYLGSHLDRPPYYLEFEYVAGGNLSEWAGGPHGFASQTLAERLGIFLKIAHAVAAAHAAGVFHLDLKPSNILMERGQDGTWQPRLTDFGIGARRNAEDEITTPRLSTSSTAGSNHPVGRGMYAPPESLQVIVSPEQDPTHPIVNPSLQDIYALGVLLFQISIADLRQRPEPAALREVPHGLLRSDIEAATHYNPEKRIQTAAELESRIRRLATREWTNYLVKSFVPTAAAFLAVVISLTGLCVSYRKMAVSAERARAEAVKYHEQKLQAITGFWTNLPNDEGLDITNMPLDDSRRAGLLREIRKWLLEQAEVEMAKLEHAESSVQRQVDLAKHALQISLLDDDAKGRKRVLDEGRTALEAALTERPNDPEVRLLLSDVYNQLGQLAFDQKDYDETLQQFGLCRKLREALVSECGHPDSNCKGTPVEYQRKHFSIIHNIGVVKFAQLLPQLHDRRIEELDPVTRRLFDELGDDLQSALEGREQLVQQDPRNRLLHRDLGDSLFVQGKILQDMGRPEDARQLLVEALTAFQTALAAPQLESTDPSPSPEGMSGSVAVSSEETAKSPPTGDPVTEQRLVETLRVLVDLELDAADVVAARKYKDDMVLQISRMLPPRIRDLNARVYFTDARFAKYKYDVDQSKGDRSLTEAELRVAEHLYTTLTTIEPDRTIFWEDLGVVRKDLGDLFADDYKKSQRDEDKAQAIVFYQSAISAWTKLKELFERLDQTDRFGDEFGESFHDMQQKLKALENPDVKPTAT